MKKNAESIKKFLIVIERVDAFKLPIEATFTKVGTLWCDLVVTLEEIELLKEACIGYKIIGE